MVVSFIGNFLLPSLIFIHKSQNLTIKHPKNIMENVVEEEHQPRNKLHTRKNITNENNQEVTVTDFAQAITLKQEVGKTSKAAAKQGRSSTGYEQVALQITEIPHGDSILRKRSHQMVSGEGLKEESFNLEV